MLLARRVGYRETFHFALPTDDTSDKIGRNGFCLFAKGHRPSFSRSVGIETQTRASGVARRGAKGSFFARAP